MKALKYISYICILPQFVVPAAHALAPALPKNCSFDNEFFKESVVLSHVEKNSSDESYKVFWDLLSGERTPRQVVQPEVGGEFYVVRCLPTGKWEVVGQGTSFGINGTLASGVVTSTGEMHSQKEIEKNAIQTGNLYERPMVGDIVAPLHVAVEKRQIASPKFEFSASEVFGLENPMTQTYEISDTGRQKLSDAVTKLGHLRGRILVESHIKREGTRAELQIESQIRATSVAQYIKREFSIGEGQIVAIGFGANEYKTGFIDVPQWPQKLVTDNIVLKVITD